jgi:predicted nucleotidyltransferase component of viral defense system
MSGKAMSLNARIRNHAKIKGISAQVVLQNYMFERFLERLSISKHKDHFILKGGLLIAAFVGIENRSTMDLDITLKNYPLNITTLTKAIKSIVTIDIDDGVTFSISEVEPIREDDMYGGFRVSVIATYDTIITPMQIDVTTGDAITPNEVVYLYPFIFNERNSEVWAYNLETVLAEKVETILSRGVYSTRPRDYYDIYILTKTQTYNQAIFRNALSATTKHRLSSHILIQLDNRVNEIKLSGTLNARWIKYTKDYKYAVGISFVDVVNALEQLVSCISQ